MTKKDADGSVLVNFAYTRDAAGSAPRSSAKVRCQCPFSLRATGKVIVQIKAGSALRLGL